MPGSFDGEFRHWAAGHELGVVILFVILICFPDNHPVSCSLHHNPSKAHTRHSFALIRSRDKEAFERNHMHIRINDASLGVYEV
jgi:hypothetical protein